MTTKTVFVTLALLLLCIQPVSAQNDESARALELFSAYQSGYFQVVAVSCFQLYSSAGIIASDFEAGVIEGALAQSALERSRLLQSVCATSLEAVRTATPLDDAAAYDEIERLAGLLLRLANLFDALDAKFIRPNEENFARADKALAELEFAMEQYTGSDQD